MLILYILFGFVLLFDLFVSYKKFNNTVSIILKAICTISMVLIPILGHLSYIVCSSLLLGGSLVDIYLFKDDNEEYYMPIKLGLLLYVVLNTINLKIFNTTLIFFIINIFILLLYLSSDNRWVKNIDLVLLVIINVLSYINIEYKLIPHIITLIMFFIDYYLIYLKEYKHKVVLDVVFIVMLIFNIIHMVYVITTIYTIITAVLYAFMIAITRKDKVVFVSSIAGYLFANMYFFVCVISNTTITYILSIILTFVCFILLDKKVLKKYHE